MTSIRWWLGWCLVLAGCAGLAGNFEYQVGPLQIGVDTNGNVSLSIGPSIQTPIGMFRISASPADKADYFGVTSTLTVRYDDTDYVYDISGQTFELKFGAGYYQGITILSDGRNILIDIRDVSGDQLVSISDSVCFVTPRAALTTVNANIRACAGTTCREIDNLYKGQNAQVVAYTVNAGGYKWWQLASGGWIRYDVVDTTPGCAAVPYMP